jgi:hypothetical protein
MNSQTVTVKFSECAQFWADSAARRLGLSISWTGRVGSMTRTSAETLVSAARIIPEGWSRRSGAAARADKLVSQALEAGR